MRTLRFSRIRRWGLLVATALAAATACGQPTDRSLEDPSSLKLRKGDVLQYRLEEDPVKSAVPMTVGVNTLGEASFPVTRGADLRVTLMVRDKTLREVKEMLTARLLEAYYRKATVELRLDQKNVVAGRVQFFGEISASIPVLPDSPPIAISDALLQLTPPDSADLRRIKIHRLDPVTQQVRTIEVDARAVIRDGRRDKDVLLQDGDRVEVPQRWIN